VGIGGFIVKNFILIAIAAVLTGCSSYTPDAGHEVVLIEKPYFFGHGGVDPDPVRTGRIYTAWSTEGEDVYMQPTKYEIEMADIDDLGWCADYVSCDCRHSSNGLCRFD
jgi:hypothetical protein